MRGEREMNQTELLLERLARGPITPLEALAELNILRLGARIWELKRRGVPIGTELVEVGADGKRVARYHLEQQP
jgi:hypothetical protein